MKIDWIRFGLAGIVIVPYEIWLRGWLMGIIGGIILNIAAYLLGGVLQDIMSYYKEKKGKNKQ